MIKKFNSHHHVYKFYALINRNKEKKQQLSYNVIALKLQTTESFKLTK